MESQKPQQKGLRVFGQSETDQVDLSLRSQTVEAKIYNSIATISFSYEYQNESDSPLEVTM